VIVMVVLAEDESFGMVLDQVMVLFVLYLILDLLMVLFDYEIILVYH